MGQEGLFKGDEFAVEQDVFVVHLREDGGVRRVARQVVQLRQALVLDIQ